MENTQMRFNMTKCAAIAGVIAAPLAAMAPATATPTTSTASYGGGASSAYGIYAGGLLNIPETPVVSSHSGPSRKSLVSLPGNSMVSLSVLRAQAVAGHSEASVADLKVLKAAIAPGAVLSAKLITARCDDGEGTSKLVDVRLAGHAIQAGDRPNSDFTVPVQGVGVVQITANKQVRDRDGRLSVTALELFVRALGRTQRIDIASATCAAGGPAEAPKPNPVDTNLPVTG
jgi:hypothetical protein